MQDGRVQKRSLRRRSPVVRIWFLKFSRLISTAFIQQRIVKDILVVCHSLIQVHRPSILYNRLNSFVDLLDHRSMLIPREPWGQVALILGWVDPPPGILLQECIWVPGCGALLLNLMPSGLRKRLDAWPRRRLGWRLEAAPIARFKGGLGLPAERLHAEARTWQGSRAGGLLIASLRLRHFDIFKNFTFRLVPIRVSSHYSGILFILCTQDLLTFRAVGVT